MGETLKDKLLTRYAIHVMRYGRKSEVKYMKIIIILVFISIELFSDVFYKPKSIEDYSRLVPINEQKVYFVPNSKLVWVKYRALRRDFPFLRGYSDKKINEWIIYNYSFVSEEQLELGLLTNTEIIVTNRFQKSFRQNSRLPHHQEFQGRGDVMGVYDDSGNLIGFIDRKGVGVSKYKYSEMLEMAEFITKLETDNEPRSMHNGLMLLGEGILECIVMEVLQRYYDILNYENNTNIFETIESYFLLQLPFNVKWIAKNPQPAVIYGS